MHQATTDVIELDKNVAIVEFYPPQSWIGKNLAQLKLRQNYNLNIIGFRENPDGVLNIDTPPSYIFKDKELLMAVVDSQTFDHFEDITK